MKSGRNIDKESLISGYSLSVESGEYKAGNMKKESESFTGGDYCYLKQSDRLQPYERQGGQSFWQYEEVRQGNKQREYLESDEEEDFNEEIVNTITRGIQHNYEKANILMEIKALRLAERKTYSDCILAFIPLILLDCNQLLELKDFQLNLIKVIKEWAPFIKEFIQEDNDEPTLIFALLDYCTANPTMSACFHLLLQALYQENVLAETSICAWYNQNISAQPLAKFIQLV